MADQHSPGRKLPLLPDSSLKKAPPARTGHPSPVPDTSSENDSQIVGAGTTAVCPHLCYPAGPGRESRILAFLPGQLPAARPPCYTWPSVILPAGIALLFPVTGSVRPSLSTLLTPPDPILPDGFRQGLLRLIRKDLLGPPDIHSLGISQGTDRVPGQGWLPGQPKCAVCPLQPLCHSIHCPKRKPQIAGFFPDGCQELLQDPAKCHRLPIGNIEDFAGSPRCLHGQFTGQGHILHTGDVHQVPAIPEKRNPRLPVGPKKSGYQAGIPDADQPPGTQDHRLQAPFLPFADDPLRHKLGLDIIV